VHAGPAVVADFFVTGAGVKLSTIYTHIDALRQAFSPDWLSLKKPISF
jgi:hypothetical protein